MEALGISGFAFGIIAFVWCTTLSEKVKKLERIIQSNGLKDREALSLRQVLNKRIGNHVTLSLYSDSDSELDGKTCMVLDIDEEWLLVRINPNGKKEAEKLIRLDLIKNVDVK